MFYVYHQAKFQLMDTQEGPIVLEQSMYQGVPRLQSSARVKGINISIFIQC